MEEWKTYKLSEIGNIVGGATPSTKIAENYDGDIPWITPKDLSDFSGRFIKYGERNITQQGFDSCSCQMLPKNSVLFSSRAPIGYVAIAAAPLCTNQGFKSVVPNEEIVDPRFLYYLLRFNKDRIAEMGSGTTFMEVSGGVMKNVEVSLPVIAIQKHIAEILSSIDDKIELNNRINHNLEEQAQALYKSWFVDFEPFKGGKFVDSELGMIPEGWRISSVADLSQKVASGGTPKSMNDSYYSGSINWFTTKELKDCFLFSSEKKITEEAVNNSSAKFFPSGTLLMAIYAAPTVGRLGILASDSTFNQAAVGIIPRDDIGVEYLYLTLLSEREKLNNLSSGAAQQNLNVGIVKDYKVIEPDSNTLRMFNRAIKSIFNLIKVNSSENEKLIKSRDALIPKLLSGELKINDLTC